MTQLPALLRGPGAGSRTLVNTCLGLRFGKEDGGVPRYWLVAIWEPFKVGKEAWGKAAVRS